MVQLGRTGLPLLMFWVQFPQCGLKCRKFGGVQLVPISFQCGMLTSSYAQVSSVP